VRAALFTIPAVAVVSVALQLSFGFVQSVQFRWVVDALVLKFPPFQFEGARSGWLRDWLIVPPLIMAVLQSYSLFRRELEDRVLSALRPLLEVALVAFLCGIGGFLPSFVAFRADWQLNKALRETSDVVAPINFNVTRPEVGNPIQLMGNTIQLTLEDMEKLYPPLSDASRILLRDATVVVSRNPASRISYSTVVRFRNGLVCTSDGPRRFKRCEMQGQK
jgi:hypothetical protein